MTTKIFIVHAEWCPHCVTLMETLQTIAETVEKIGGLGNPSKNDELNTKGASTTLNINGTIVVLIEEKQLNKPEIKGILGNTHIAGFPTILEKKNNGLVEYNGGRDKDSLLKLFETSSAIGGRTRKRRRKRTRKRTERKRARKRARKKARKTSRKKVSWLF
jgi:thiol-disulfide isomerase/thioredoxin